MAMAVAPANHTICFLLLLITLLMISPCLSAGDTNSPCFSGDTNVIFSDIGGGILDTTQNLYYKDRYYTLFMQPDCNLCIYGPKLYWCTSTANLGKNCQLKLQSNGELVLSGCPWYAPCTDRKVVWRSGKTSTEGSYALVLNYDGSLSVYGPPIWSVPSSLKIKSTASTDTCSGSLGNPVSRAEPILWTDDEAPVGTVMANGDYKLVLDENCNLTLSNDKTKETLWSTKTTNANSYDCFVALEKNGLLHIKYRGGASVWNSGLKGPDNSEYVLALRPDGKLAVYGPLIWKVANQTANGKKIAMVSEE